MPKERIPYPSKDELKEHQEQFKKRHGFDFTRKARYFVDESLGVHTTALIREWGHNVKDVHDVGIAGQPDENVFQYAQRHRRIILTHDDDFLNNSVFPLKGCHGIAIFPCGDGGNLGLLKTLGHFLAATTKAGVMFQTKLKIGEDLTWTIVKLTDEGTVTKTKYDLSDPNHVFEMT
jgi:predicted nuclease of predicted toxin-antitoxin system